MILCLSQVLTLFLSLAAISTLATALFVPNEAVAAKAKGKKPKSDKRLSVYRYDTMRPFTLPLIQNVKVLQQFTIVIAMELGYEDAHSDIRPMVPRFPWIAWSHSDGGALNYLTLKFLKSWCFR